MARTAFLRELDAAEYLGVPVRTLRHWRQKGRISYIQFGGPRGVVRYKQGDLDRYIDACKVEAS